MSCGLNHDTGLCVVQLWVVLQLRLSDLHGGSDRVRNEIPRVSQHRASRSRSSQLSRRTQLPHQDIRLRHESQPLRPRLLQDRGSGRAAHPLDGLGERSAGEWPAPPVHVGPGVFSGWRNGKAGMTVEVWYDSGVCTVEAGMTVTVEAGRKTCLSIY